MRDIQDDGKTIKLFEKDVVESSRERIKPMVDLCKGDCSIKRAVHPDWLKLKNEMTTRMSHHSIDMSFLLKFYDYIDSGYPVWEHEEKREIVLKEQEKTKQWQNYCRKLEEKIKQLEDTI